MARTADFLRTGTGESRSRPGRTGEDYEAYDVVSTPEPVGRSYDEERDWRSPGILSLGIIAGVALLLAPQSGEETREQIAIRARRLGSRADAGWDDLRDELRRLRRRSRRAATRGRWKVEDLLD
jgi:hypothetical protein